MTPRGAWAAALWMAVSVAVGPAHAQPPAESWTLPNDLRVLFIPAPGAPMTACVALVGVGSADEKPRMYGAAHLLEHLLFNGTRTLSQEELYARIDALGAYANAATRQDFTMFQMLAPREHAADAAALLAQMLFDSTLPRAAFDKEKGIVIQELRRGVGPAERMLDAADAHLLAGTPYARREIGTAAEITAIDRADVLAFYERGYVPRNVTLVVMGAGTVAEVRPWIDAAFGAGRRRPYARAIPRKPAWPREGQWSVAPSPDGRTLLVARYPAPQPGGAGYAAALVLVAALDRHVLVPADVPRVEELTASLDVGRWFTHLLLTVPADGADPYDTLFAWRRTLRRLADAIPADLDLAPVRTHLAFEDASLRDRPHYYPFFRGPEFILRPTAETVALPDAVAGVEVADVRAAARAIFAGPHAAVMLVPDVEARLVTPPPLQQLPSPVAPVGEPGPNVRTLSERWTNGVRLQVREEPGLRVGAIHVLVEGRGAREPDGQAGIAELLHRSLLGGTTSRDEAALEHALTAMGARVKTHDNPDIPYDNYALSPAYSYIRVEVVSERVPDALAVLAEVLASATYPEAVVHWERETLVRDASRARDHPQGRARRMLYATLFGEASPFAQPPLGDPEAIAGLTADDLRAFHAQYFAPAAWRVTIVSGLAAPRVRDLARAILHGTPAAAAASQPTLPPLPAPAAARLDGDSGRPQAHLLVGQRVRVAPDDRAAALVATEWLNSRLQQVLREERGWAYSVGAGLRWNAPTPVWLASFTGDTAHLPDVEAEMRATVEHLQRELLAPADVVRMANSLYGRQQMRRLSAINRAYYWAMRTRQGGGAPSFNAANAIADGRLTPERVRAAAQTLWNPDVWVVIHLNGAS